MSAGQQSQFIRRAPWSRPSECAATSTAKREVVGSRLLSHRWVLRSCARAPRASSGRPSASTENPRCSFHASRVWRSARPHSASSSARTCSSLPPTSPERYSSAVMTCEASSGSVTTRSPRRSSAVCVSVSMRSARKSISTPPRASIVTARASEGLPTCSGVGASGVTRRFLRMSALPVTSPSESTFSRLRRLRASEWSVNPLEGNTARFFLELMRP